MPTSNSLPILELSIKEINNNVMLVMVLLLGVILQEYNFVLSITHSLGFCVDCFPELDGSVPTSKHRYIISVNSSELTNWLHLSVTRDDLQGRIEGMAIQAIDQDGLPVGRFGFYRCLDDNKYAKATREIIHLDCDVPNENMKEHPNVACFSRPEQPPKESHITWRFTEADKSRIKSVQFMGLVVENFAKKKSFSNIRSPKIIVNPVSSDAAHLAVAKADLEGKCHLTSLSSQWTFTDTNQEISTNYVHKIKQYTTQIPGQNI